MLSRIPQFVLVLLSLLLGAVYALLSVKLGWNEFTMNYIDPFGKIFINLLKLIAVPLVLFSIISGVASLKDLNKLGRIGIRTFSLFVGTTLGATLIGLLMANVFNPGEHAGESLRKQNRLTYESWAKAQNKPMADGQCFSCQLSDTARPQGTDLMVENEWVQEKLAAAANTGKTSTLQPLVDAVPANLFKALADMEMLQIIFFALFFGAIMLRLSPQRFQSLDEFVNSANDVFILMVGLVMRGMPFFVFCLMAGALVSAAGTDPAKLAQLFQFLLWYSIAVVVGLVMHVVLVYGGILMIFVRKVNLFAFLKSMGKAQLTAFSTSSSAATLPVTLQCVEHNLGVSKRISSFVLPIGATVNMDGTSLYQVVAALSLAQLFQIDLSLSQQLTVVGMAVLASIGAAAIPSAGLILLIVVLDAVGLNPAWFALIIPVDRLLDMCRTVVNITGDAAVATVIANSEGELNSPDCKLATA